MQDFDQNGSKNLLRRAFLRVKVVLEVTNVNKIPLYAAHACYFMVLAAFPMLLLVLSLLRYTPLQVMDLITVVEGFVPAALLPTVERVIINTYDNATGAVISVSAVAALWSAGRSIFGLMLGLNVIYGVKESRGYFYTRAICVLYMFLFFVVLLMTLLLHVFGQAILGLLHLPDYPVFRFLRVIVESRFSLLLLVQTALFTAMYAALPNRKNSPIACLPGAVLASLGWQGFSMVFSLYMDYFPLYANIYGSVYAVALSLLWLYCCMFIIFLGGAVNRYVVWRREGKA